MLATFLGHVRSNVVAYAALFFALTAPATASIINGALIQNGSVTGADVKNESLTGADVLNDSLKGDDVHEASLGKVPYAGTADFAPLAIQAEDAQYAENADRLDGEDSTEFLGAPVVVRQHTVPTLPQSTATGAAACQAGEQVVSGGMVLLGPVSESSSFHAIADGPAVVSSGHFAFPNDGETPTHWLVTITTDDLAATTTPGFLVYALCSPIPG